MIVFYKNENQSHHVRLIEHLYRSYPGKKKSLVKTSEFFKNVRLNQAANCIVFAGIIRGEGNIYQYCIRNNKRFLYMDHAYINRGYSSDPEEEWMRITDSRFSWNVFEEQNSDRFDNFFSEKIPLIKGYRNNDTAKKILILPPSLATQFIFPESRVWLQKVTSFLVKNTNRDIVIREKPIQTKLTPRNMVVEAVKYKHERTIEEELADAYAVITYNSAVVVQAAMMGIPVHSHENGCGAPISFNIEDIDNLPPEPPRRRWLHQLVHHQFRTTEMIDGSIWPMIFKDEKID